MTSVALYLSPLKLALSFSVPFNGSVWQSFYYVCPHQRYSVFDKFDVTQIVTPNFITMRLLSCRRSDFQIFCMRSPSKCVRFENEDEVREREQKIIIYLVVCSPLSILNKLACPFILTFMLVCLILLTLFLFLFSIFVLRRQEWNKEEKTYFFFLKSYRKLTNEQTKWGKKRKERQKKNFTELFNKL